MVIRRVGVESSATTIFYHRIFCTANFLYFFFEPRRTLVSFLVIVLLRATATRKSGVNNVCQKIRQLHGQNVMVGAFLNWYGMYYSIYEQECFIRYKDLYSDKARIASILKYFKNDPFYTYHIVSLFAKEFSI